SDVFTAAVNNSNFDLQSLIDSMKSAAPIAHQFGMSIEDTTAMLSVMRDVNIDASSSGTGLRNMFLKLSSESGREKFNKDLKELTGTTIKMVDAQKNLRHLPDIMFDIGAAMKDLGTAEAGSLLSNLFGLRAIVPGMVLSGAGGPFAKIRKILLESRGIAEETRKIMESGIGGAFRSFLS